MTRLSKQRRRRSENPHRPTRSSVKTGSVKDNLPLGYKPHTNGLANAELAQTIFIPKIQ